LQGHPKFTEIGLNWFENMPCFFSAIRDKFLIAPPSKPVDPILTYEREGYLLIPRMKAQYGQPFAIEELFYNQDLRVKTFFLIWS
jgi:hypothetical protein